MLSAAIIGMPAAAQAQTVIIINGNQPYYPPYPYQYNHQPVVYGYPGYYGAGYYNGYYNGYYPAYGYGHYRPYWGW